MVPVALSAHKLHSLQLRLSLAPLVLASLLLPAAARAQVSFTGVQTTLGNGFVGPWGVAVDRSGNVFVADINQDAVKEILAAGGYTTVKTLSSGFSNPFGVAVDGSGNVYVADSGLSLVKEMLAVDGSISTSPTIITLGSGFNAPAGVAVDGSGNVYVADTDNSLVKEILAVGGSVPATNPTIITLGSGFTNPYGVAVDGNGNVFVADSGNSAVKEILAVGGSIPASPTINTLGSGFNYPQGVAIDESGNVYVADSNNNVVKEILAVGGSIPATNPTINVLGSGFSEPTDVAVDGHGDVFVADWADNRIEELQLLGGNFAPQPIGSTSASQTLNFSISSGTTVGSIAVLTGGAANLDFANATGSTCAATTYSSATTCGVNVTFTPTAAGMRQGAVVFSSGVSDTGTVLASVPVYGVGTGSQIAFSPSGVIAFDVTVDGIGLNLPYGGALDGAGDLFIADTDNNRVVELPAGGGAPIAITSTVNGVGLSGPTSVALDGAGDLFIADEANNRVVKVPTGGGAAIAIDPTLDGKGLEDPIYVMLDGAGDLFISDSTNHRVVEVPAGGGTPIAISPTANGVGLYYPWGLAVDGAGDLFIQDDNPGGGRVVEVPAGGGAAIAIDPTVNGETLGGEGGLASDGAGDLFIADIDNSRIVEVPAGGGAAIAIDPTVNGVSLLAPYDVAVDGAGDLFIMDNHNNRVVEIQRAQPPALSFASTPVGQISGDSPQTVALENIGNSPLTFPVPSSGNNPAISANFTLDNGGESSCPLVTASSTAGTLAAGASCLLRINFAPTTSGSLIGTLTLTDTNLNATSPSYANQVISLNGTGTASGTPDAATLTSPTPGSKLGISNVQFKWTTGTGVTQYDLWLGLSGPGSSSLYTSGWLTTTSTTVTSLPAKGATVYARLYSDVDGKVEYNDYTYTEAGTPAAISTPAPGSTLGTTDVKFTWTAGYGVTEYDLWLGLSGPGSSSLYTSGWVITTSTAVASLPAKGATVYARLYSMVEGVVQYNDYTYTEASPTGTPATMTSPTPGSTLGTSSVKFTWTTGTGATEYQLWLGLSGPDSSSLYTSGWVTSTSVTVPSLPAKGATVYARLYSDVNGVTQYNDYTYTEALPAGTPATMTSPTSGSTLGTSGVMFTWTTGTGVTQYDLWLGLSGPGSSSLYTSGWVTSTSVTVPSLPAKGATVYARLYSDVNGVTQYNDYTYAEAGTAAKQTVSLVQKAYSGDNSNCATGSPITCTVSATVGVSKLSTIGAGHLLIVWFGMEGTTQFPVAGTPVCNGSGCGTWVHLSSSPTTVTLTTGTSSNCWNDYEIQTGGHHYVTDCYAVWTTTGGSTSITDTITDTAGASDVTNADMFVSEWDCSTTCSPSLDASGAVFILPGTCTSCVGPALTLTGTNDLVIPIGIFSELYSSVSSPYTLMFNDPIAGNAIAYNADTSSGIAATWGSSPIGGGIFMSVAINLGFQ